MSYTKSAILGFSWQTILKIATYGLTLVKIFILARLLTPKDFGLFSLTAIALGLSESVTQTGVNLTIIQSKHSIGYFLNTAWVIAIIRGLLIGIIMLVLGMLLGKYFQEPQLTLLIAVAALIPVVKGFINPSIVSLHKEMRFFRDTVYKFSIILVEAVGAVILGWWLRSAYALVLGMVVGSLFEVLISFVFFQHRPVFQYLVSRAKVIFANARWLSLATLLNYLNENLDDFILGKIVGTYNLGLYHNAYALSHKANYDLAKSIHHSTMPVYTRIHENTLRLKRAFTKSSLASLAVTITASLPLLLVPELIVKIVLGDQWLAAIPLVRPLVVAGLIQAFSLVCYTVFFAVKKYSVINLHLGLTLALMVSLMIYLGLNWGLAGAVMGLVIARTVTLPIVFYGIRKVLFQHES